MNKIKKIPLKYLIDVLEALYDEGIDFIDIQGGVHPDDGEDTITISYLEEYYSPEIERKSNEEIKQKPISDEDIDKLV
jgi:hypothetical protein